MSHSSLIVTPNVKVLTSSNIETVTFGMTISEEWLNTIHKCMPIQAISLPRGVVGD